MFNRFKKNASSPSDQPNPSEQPNSSNMSDSSQAANPSGPSDAKVAADMADLAQGFIAAAASQGQEFALDPAYAIHLDPWVDELLANRPSDEVIHSVIMGMGAYVGEIIVHGGGGSWSYDPNEQAPVVTLKNDLQCYPLNKVAKRIHVGPEHSIAQFVGVSMTGELPPQARIIDPQDP